MTERKSGCIPREEYRVRVFEVKVHHLAEHDRERHVLVELGAAIGLGNLDGDLLELERLKALGLVGNVREVVVCASEQRRQGGGGVPGSASMR